MPTSKSKTAAGSVQKRLWLMYPPKLITNPVVWELGPKISGHDQCPPGQRDR